MVGASRGFFEITHFNKQIDEVFPTQSSAVYNLWSSLVHKELQHESKGFFHGGRHAEVSDSGL